MANGSKKFVLVSNDEIEFPVSLAALKQSMIMQNMLESCCDPEDPNMGPIPVAKADAKTLKLVVEWCEKHEKDEESDDAEAKETNRIPAWDKEFLHSKSYMEIVALCSVANYLEMHKLMLYLAIHIGTLGANKEHNETARFYGYEVTDFKTMCFK